MLRLLVLLVSISPRLLTLDGIILAADLNDINLDFFVVNLLLFLRLLSVTS